METKKIREIKVLYTTYLGCSLGGSLRNTDNTLGSNHWSFVLGFCANHMVFFILVQVINGVPWSGRKKIYMYF